MSLILTSRSRYAQTVSYNAFGTVSAHLDEKCRVLICKHKNKRATILSETTISG